MTQKVHEFQVAPEAEVVGLDSEQDFQEAVEGAFKLARMKPYLRGRVRPLGQAEVDTFVSMLQGYVEQLRLLDLNVDLVERDGALLVDEPRVRLAFVGEQVYQLHVQFLVRELGEPYVRGRLHKVEVSPAKQRPELHLRDVDLLVRRGALVGPQVSLRFHSLLPRLQPDLNDVESRPELGGLSHQEPLRMDDGAIYA